MHLVAPHALAVAAAQGEHDAAQRGDVEPALVECRAGRERGRDPARPAALAGPRVERHDTATRGFDVHALVVGDGRELGERVEPGSPQLRERRALLSLGILPVVRGIEAPARPGDRRVGRHALDDLGVRGRVLRRREVRDRPAVHVLGRAQCIPEQSRTADHDDRGEQQRAPAASPPGARIHRCHGRTAPGAIRLVVTHRDPRSAHRGAWPATCGSDPKCAGLAPTCAAPLKASRHAESCRRRAVGRTHLRSSTAHRARRKPAW